MHDTRFAASKKQASMPSSGHSPGNVGLPCILEAIYVFHKGQVKSFPKTPSNIREKSSQWWEPLEEAMKVEYILECESQRNEVQTKWDRYLDFVGVKHRASWDALGPLFIVGEGIHSGKRKANEMSVSVSMEPPVKRNHVALPPLSDMNDDAAKKEKLNELRQKVLEQERNKAMIKEIRAEAKDQIAKEKLASSAEVNGDKPKKKGSSMKWTAALVEILLDEM